MASCCSCFSFLGGSKLSAADVKKQKALSSAQALVRELVASKSAGPILVRLAWHDSGTYDKSRESMPWPDAGGAVGSIRFDHEILAGPNAGLKKAVTAYLKPIKDQVPDISWADLIQMGSAEAIQSMGGPKIPMTYGRVDGEPKNPADPPFGLPDALPPFGGGADGLKDPQDPAEHLRFVFDKYGMDDRDIVALSGAHTIGRAFKDRSGAVEEGYLGGTVYTKRGCPYLEKSETAGGRSWTKDWLTFNNSYFTDMLSNDLEIVNFPTDLVLTNDPGFSPHFNEFAASEAAFFTAYAASHKKLSELGAKFDPPGGLSGV